MAVSFQTLSSSAAGGLTPAGMDASGLDRALDGSTGTGPNVIVPPSVSVIVSISFVTAYVAAWVSEWAKIGPKSVSGVRGRKASVDAPAVIVRLLPLVS